MRRFSEYFEGEDYAHVKLKEWPADRVAIERKQAYAHKYGLLKTEFAMIANGRKVEAY